MYAVNSVNIAFDLGAFACKSNFLPAGGWCRGVEHLQIPLHPLQALQKTAKQLVIEVKRLCRTDALFNIRTAPIGSFGDERTRLPR